MSNYILPRILGFIIISGGEQQVPRDRLDPLGVLPSNQYHCSQVLLAMSEDLIARVRRL